MEACGYDCMKLVEVCGLYPLKKERATDFYVSLPPGKALSIVAVWLLPPGCCSDYYAGLFWLTG